MDDAQTEQTKQAEIAVVVRYTDYPDTSPEQRVDLMRWYLDLEEADQEAARLNAVRAWEGVVYFVKLLPERRGKGLPH